MMQGSVRISIKWDDLTQEKQKEIISMIGQKPKKEPLGEIVLVLGRHFEARRKA